MRTLSFKLSFGAIFMAAVLAGFESNLAAADFPKLGPADGLGVCIHFVDPRPGEMEMLAQAGFHYVRMDFIWEWTEKEKGVYDFSAYDRLMENFDKFHLRALFILCYSNPLYDGGLSPASDEGRQAFAHWAAAAAKHFQGRGVLWEMYNEPNIDFWKPKPDVKQYVKLALDVGKSLRDAAPEELYIGPASSTFDFAFLEECFRSGLLEYWSGITVHPYREAGPETAIDEYARLRKMIDQYTPKGKTIPVLCGEWGYTAWNNRDEAAQGKLLPRQWLTNLMCGVPLSIWYDWHDDGQDPKEVEHHFGVVRFPYDASRQPVYEPKPAYLSAQTLSRILNGFQFQKRLPTDSAEDYLMIFTKNDETRWVAWTTSATPHSVRLPLAAGEYQIEDHTGQRLANLTADAQGLSMTLTDAPQYILPAQSQAK